MYSGIAGGYKKLGPLCGSRGAVWTNAWRRPKITNPLNNPDWPRHKACANISWSACLWLTYFAGVLKSGRQLLCPRETKEKIIATPGQPWVCKIKPTHHFCEQLPKKKKPTDVENKSRGKVLHHHTVFCELCVDLFAKQQLFNHNVTGYVSPLKFYISLCLTFSGSPKPKLEAKVVGID